MTVKELFEKYCGKTEDNEYICRGHCVTLDPATDAELSGFRELCKEYGVDQQVVDELEEFYSQTRKGSGNSFENGRYSVLVDV